MVKVVLRFAFASVWMVCIATSAGAQVPANSLRGVLIDFAARQGDQAAEQQVASFGSLFALEVSAAPLGTSTGGFTFEFDRQSGTFVRSSRSFGPAFAERSLTTGKGKFGAGFHWLHADYDSLGGMNLKNNELLTGRNIQSPGSPLSYGAFNTNLASDTVVLFATVGVTDNVDIGIAVPWVRISMDAEIALFSASGVDLTAGAHPILPKKSASGLGDIALFTKYHFWRIGEGGLSGQVELRFPTGDEDNFRGLGVTRTLVTGIWSKGGRIAPHANIGYEVWSGGVDISPTEGIAAKDQVRYALGVELQAHPRLTAMIDLVGRRLLNGGALEYRRVPFQVPGLPAGSIEALLGAPRGLNVLALAPGFKWNAFQSLLVTGNLLTSLQNDGLRANIVPVFGVDWAF